MASKTALKKTAKSVNKVEKSALKPSRGSFSVAKTPPKVVQKAASRAAPKTTTKVTTKEKKELSPNNKTEKAVSKLSLIKEALFGKGKSSKIDAKVSKKAEGSSKASAKGEKHTAPVATLKSKAKGTPALGITSLRSPVAGVGKNIDSEAVCREVACEGLATTGGYCRLHYIKNWKKIKRKELILKEKKLNQYIEELVVKYPDKYIEAIRQDLANDKDFAKVIHDLDLDESVDDFEGDSENMDNLIDNIKRDFEDEGDF